LCAYKIEYFYFFLEKIKMEDGSNILLKSYFSHSELVSLLQSEGKQMHALFERASKIKSVYTGSKTYLRGLIEFSNLCAKDCYYCGIRRSNRLVHRYKLTDHEILDAVRFADQCNFGSIVLQSGEQNSASFVSRITNLLRAIEETTQGRIAVTLCVGEQTDEVYLKWFEAGAKRYLLRIETTNPILFRSLHPKNKLHDYSRRLNCLYSLKGIGYQTGTGVMIGLPGQTLDDLADDLLFFEEFGIDMVGMGPYLEHSQTPLYDLRNKLLPIEHRFDLALKMIAILRILMKDINIAATTALQTMDPFGREKGIMAGANVIMPNITPRLYRNDYLLYENKPCTDDDPAQCRGCLDARVAMAGSEIAYGESGTSAYFESRKQFELNC
jgi:biotin synthase